MSENNFLPGADEAGATDNRRNVILLGGLGAVVLAGAGYYFLAGGSSTDAQVTAAPVVQRHVAKVPAKAPAAKAAKPAIIPVTSTVPIGRNPFKVLYVAPAQGAAPGGTAPATTTSSTTSSTSTSSGTATTTAVAPYKMTLVSVTGGANNTAREYTFTYSGLTKTVIAGQRFGVGGHVVVLAYLTSSTGKVTGALVQIGDDDPIPVPIKGTFQAS